ncbi:ParB/RepB/Spo0J family partition protein [Iningainema tapete]|uniref:ParB/RepB/Spo0J family partition protein n=1 Tax=Iningainema tapete BLCC-T55 TaxID=2748662 RepID=A0A8J6XE95_9CYAN|nr:ParB/RepB/Spo0J family partition protein [Iningainema tapete]MBD2770711.1 ParB/RepB/Spo0J family partition protein [Iningainema tapete BLCC-T55]
MTKKPLTPPKMRGVEDLLTMDVEAGATTTCPIEKIQVSPKQPRRYFDTEKMAQLVQSVREHGILEPLLVRTQQNGEYELIAGERRLRAAKDVGLTEVPIVIKDFTDKQALQVALLENLQREDLNPVEETEGILELLKIELDISTESVISLLNQAANAKKRGLELTENVSRQMEIIESLLSGVGSFNAESFRTSRLPLLNLPDDVLEVLRQGKLEYTKARAIARVTSKQQRTELLTQAINNNLSLSEIKLHIKELQQSSPTLLTPSLKERVDETFGRFKKAKVWDDPKKKAKVEKLLAQLEALMSGD